MAKMKKVVVQLSSWFDYPGRTYSVGRNDPLR